MQTLIKHFPPQNQRHHVIAITFPVYLSLLLHLNVLSNYSVFYFYFRETGIKITQNNQSSLGLFCLLYVGSAEYRNRAESCW